MRDVWNKCSKPVEGPRNWGNSGVKIFNLSAVNGAEIAISDFVWGKTEFATNAAPGDTVPSDVDKCESGTERLTYGQLCGAIYDKHSPQAKPPIIAGVSAVNDPRPSGNDWNTLEIGFMACRYDGNGNLVKLATVSVKINTTSVLTHIGIPNSMTMNRQDDDYPAGPNKGNPVYPGGANWKREFGPIYLQEHDNMIEFKDIRINPDWLPLNDDGTFDTEWQEDPL